MADKQTSVQEVAELIKDIQTWMLTTTGVPAQDPTTAEIVPL